MKKHDIKQIKKKKKKKQRHQNIYKKQFIACYRSSETERDCKDNDEMEPLEEEEEEEEEGEEQENVDEEEEPPQKTKKKRVKHGPRGLWKQDLVYDLVDIIITNDYNQRKLIFVNTKNQQNGKVSKNWKAGQGARGIASPQVRMKFKKCISECKKAALTIKTATGASSHLKKFSYLSSLTPISSFGVDCQIHFPRNRILFFKANVM